MITVLGAGGAIGGELAKLLASSNRPFRLVGRNLRGAPGATETVAADLTDLDQTFAPWPAPAWCTFLWA